MKSQKTIDFIDSRLSLLVNDLDASESNIEKFKKDLNERLIQLLRKYGSQLLPPEGGSLGKG